MSHAQPDPLNRHRVPFDGQFSLADCPTGPPAGTPSKGALQDELEDQVDELDRLQQLLFADERFAVLAVFQGVDAAGKDSTIGKVFSGVNPAGFRVHPELLAAQKLPESHAKRTWQERFESIRDFERHLAGNGTVIVKFWLYVSRRRQAARFRERIEDPDKNWKFRLGDLDDRAHWRRFMKAYQEMLRETSRE
ncbi:MAG: polyphosphate kinase 2 family protein [Gammaproteobacteria bacterium]